MSGAQRPPARREPAPAPVEVLVHVRDGCHLCERALDELAALSRQEPFAVREVDIEADEELHRRYLERIPVIVVAGEELGDFFVDAPRVLDAVRAARRTVAAGGAGADGAAGALP